MKRTAVVALVASLALIGSTAAAARTSYPTTISFGTGFADGANEFLAGNVHSPRAGCRPGRTVKLFANRLGGGSKLVDTDRTSAQGAWAAGGDFTGAASATARVTRKNIGTHSNPRICRAAEVLIKFA